MRSAPIGARLSPAIRREMWEKWIFLASLGAINCLMRGIDRRGRGLSRRSGVCVAIARRSRRHRRRGRRCAVGRLPRRRASDADREGIAAWRRRCSETCRAASRSRPRRSSAISSAAARRPGSTRRCSPPPTSASSVHQNKIGAGAIEHIAIGRNRHCERQRKQSRLSGRRDPQVWIASLCSHDGLKDLIERVALAFMASGAKATRRVGVLPPAQAPAVRSGYASSWRLRHSGLT